MPAPVCVFSPEGPFRTGYQAEGQLRVALTRSANRWRMAGVCASRPFLGPTSKGNEGRFAVPQGSTREGPEFAQTRHSIASAK